MQVCYPEMFATKTPSALTPTFCYFLLLEANDNPYTVQDRFEKSTIDLAFDTARLQKGRGENSTSESADYDEQTWTKI